MTRIVPFLVNLVESNSHTPSNLHNSALIRPLEELLVLAQESVQELPLNRILSEATH